MYRKLTLIILGTAIALFASAQSMTLEQYEARYNAMVKNLGPSGIGIETLLNKWEKDFPDNDMQIIARFAYYLDKCQSTEVLVKDATTFLGEQPTFSLKDSLGNNVNYFQETFYDDELFGKAISSIDKAIQLFPNRLDLRFYKITSYIAYEKESPDMAKADLKSLVEYHFTQNPTWEYPGQQVVDDEFFTAAIQEFCFTFFRIATPTSYEAFKDLSQAVLKHKPENVLFLDNIGSYYFVAKSDHKTALKYYNKVLKIDKADMTAIKNCILLARKDSNKKMEKKYLAMMLKYGSEVEKASAQARLNYYNNNK